MPGAKYSGWCRARCPLEETDRFRPPHVGEVFLVRPTAANGSSSSNNNNGPDYELPEGPTSNLFVITRDGTLRTAPPADGRPTALRGYAQTLVIGAAERCGIPVDTAGPVRVGDGGGDGGESRMWEEMFVTSSVRLIVPVGRLFVPEYGGESGMVLRTLWTHGGGTGWQGAGMAQVVQGTAASQSVHGGMRERGGGNGCGRYSNRGVWTWTRFAHSWDKQMFDTPSGKRGFVWPRRTPFAHGDGAGTRPGTPKRQETDPPPEFLAPSGCGRCTLPPHRDKGGRRERAVAPIYRPATRTNCCCCSLRTVR